MIEQHKIQIEDVIFIYKQPVEKSIVGVVSDIDYPVAEILTVPYRKNDNDEMIKIDLSTDITLSVLDERKIKIIMSKEEQKILKKKIVEIRTRIDDIFED